MPPKPSKPLLNALQSIIDEVWRIADRAQITITTHGDDAILSTGGELVTLRKPPTVTGAYKNRPYAPAKAD